MTKSTSVHSRSLTASLKESSHKSNNCAVREVYQVSKDRISAQESRTSAKERSPHRGPQESRTREEPEAATPADEEGDGAQSRQVCEVEHGVGDTRAQEDKRSERRGVLVGACEIAMLIDSVSSQQTHQYV